MLMNKGNGSIVSTLRAKLNEVKFNTFPGVNNCLLRFTDVNEGAEMADFGKAQILVEPASGPDSCLRRFTVGSAWTPK
ncbi:hypothetical protein HDF16_005446 [Granulicella aggregans]|uniref:Uncharacterized protein n=1 Tax=Granulicella aggregans TaxID=474949 RepID=A0A7W8E7W6_9BACT|nr:hypothetical protein [Granulicella aggregans]